MADDSADWPYIEDLEGFQRLLTELVGYVSAETGTDLVSMNDLRDAVYDAIQWYEIDRSVAASSSKVTLHEISPHIERVIELIAQEENKHHVLLALGNFDGYSADLDNAVNHYESLISDLRKIARDVPKAVKRSKGRPFRKELRVLVERLADFWVFATDRPFDHSWHREPNGSITPLTNATRFVYAVVEFVDPQSVKALLKITENVVKDRNAAMRGGGIDPRVALLGPHPWLHRKIYPAR